MRGARREGRAAGPLVELDRLRVAGARLAMAIHEFEEGTQSVRMFSQRGRARVVLSIQTEGGGGRARYRLPGVARWRISVNGHSASA
jgi:hypothetical protein